MNLNGQVLRDGMSCDLVGPLQSELRLLSFAIAADELDATRYGPTTHAAVVEFQRRNGHLDVTGTINQCMSGDIEAAVAAILSQLEPIQLSSVVFILP